MNPIASAYATLRARLLALVAERVWPSPEAGFTDLVGLSYGREITQHNLVTERLSETPILASVGYQYANPAFARPSGYDAEWKSHFGRLASRNAFPIDRESYFYRPLDLLGLCLGARYCPHLNDGDRGWLKDVLQGGRSRLQQGTFAYILGTFSAMQLGIVWPIAVPPAMDQTLAMLGLLHWLFRETEFVTAQRVAAPSADLEIALLQQALTAIGDVSDVAEAALVLHSTSEVVNKAIQSQVQESWAIPAKDRDAIRLVTNLCDRFPIMANTLKARHNGRSTLEITDEYDVQDLFTAMLRLHFDDVRPEEWTPSYAGNSSRIDFLLKEFGFAIEVKMTRKNLDQKELTNQLAVDILRYQSHPDCKTLLCFVYDPEGHCTTPNAMENDLTRKHGRLEVVVIVRPHLR
jgi:hypothetical protein